MVEIKTRGLKTLPRFSTKMQPKKQWLFVMIDKIRKSIFLLCPKKYS